MIDSVLKQLESDSDAALERLCQLLKIKSISTDPAYAGACVEAADWVAEDLRHSGLDTTVHPTDGHPIVMGRYDGAGKDAPTVLFYGHYDVQPPDPLDLWDTPPFEPTVRDNKLFARGASDDKGQVMCFLESLRAWKAVHGKPPVNVTVVIEGEEECGSVNMDLFLESHKASLDADIAVVSDTSMWDRGVPAITYALRGLLYFDLKLFGPNRDLHSGVYGGTMANPANELIKVLGGLFDADHKVTVEGFYDDVVQLEDSEIAQWKKLGFEDKVFGDSIGVDALYGEAGFSTLERRWVRPSCDINGLYGGYMGEGAKTVIPSFVGAKISFRLAANQDPAKIEAAFRQWVLDHTPVGCRWEINSFGQASPVLVPTDSPYLASARKAVETGCGRPPVLVREGATIPVVASMKSMLNLDTLLIGFGLNDDNLHSPNEKFELDNFRMGCRTHAALLAELASA
jgi:acetylornithine deacetylase/succinyl-diaminopimelate desuccinylase-like protein